MRAMSRDTQHMWRLFGRYSAVGIEMATALCISAMGGNWLDQRFHIAPWGLLLGFVVGGGAAIKTIARLMRHAKDDVGGPGPPAQS